jgi:DNA-binding response OmpR family regulator
LHALVIEDQLLIAALIEDELADLGYATCDIVDNEADAIAAAERRCPDIITADDRLAKGSGVTAVREICARRVIPVIFTVGDPSVLAPTVAFATVLGKPFGGARLREAVSEAIALAETHGWRRPPAEQEEAL